MDTQVTQNGNTRVACPSIIIPKVETHTYDPQHPSSLQCSIPRSFTVSKQDQMTCLLLLLLLKVPVLSTAFLMLFTFCTISLAIFGFSASKSYLFVPPSLCTMSLKAEEDLADC